MRRIVKTQVDQRTGLQRICKALSRSLCAFGDTEEFTKIFGQTGNDLIGFPKWSTAQHDRRGDVAVARPHTQDALKNPAPQTHRSMFE